MSATNDYVLLGPGGSGKTTIGCIITGEDITKQHSETGDVHLLGNTGFGRRAWNWGRGVYLKVKGDGRKFYAKPSDKILDTPALDNPIYYAKPSEGLSPCEKWIKNSKKVIFIIDGIKLLKATENENYKDGNPITWLIAYVYSVYDNLGKNKNTLFFLITHADMYSGTRGEMLDKIVEQINNANQDYFDSTGVERYPFAKYFHKNASKESINPHFMCINATNQVEVGTAFDIIANA